MTEFEKADRKESILKAAQNLFAKFGLAKTTIEDIAHRTRMGKASIYYYFQSKEALFQEVIDKEGWELRIKIQKAVNAESTSQRKIRAYLITRMLTSKELLNYYSAFRDEYLQHYSFIEKARQSYYKFELNLIKSILQEGIEQETFRITDLGLTAEAILAALKGLEYQWSLDEPVEAIEQNIDILLDILFKGIEKRG